MRQLLLTALAAACLGCAGVAQAADQLPQVGCELRAGGHYKGTGEAKPAPSTVKENEFRVKVWQEQDAAHKSAVVPIGLWLCTIHGKQQDDFQAPESISYRFRVVDTQTGKVMSPGEFPHRVDLEVTPLVDKGRISSQVQAVIRQVGHSDVYKPAELTFVEGYAAASIELDRTARMEVTAQIEQ